MRQDFRGLIGLIGRIGSDGGGLGRKSEKSKSLKSISIDIVTVVRLGCGCVEAAKGSGLTGCVEGWRKVQESRCR